MTAAVRALLRAVVRRPGRTTDRGSATLLVLGVAGLLVTVTAGMLAVAGTLAARQRADSAADLAALAAARAATSPTGLAPGPGGQGCALAGRVAEAAGARVVACVAGGPASRPGVSVVVEVPLPRLLSVLDVPPARARARAGLPP